MSVLSRATFTLAELFTSIYNINIYFLVHKFIVLLQRPLLTASSSEISDVAFEELLEAYEFLNAFMEKTTWLAGEEVTIADISILSTLSTLDLVIPVEEEKYPRLADWLQRGKQLPFFDEGNSKGLEMVKTFVEAKLGM